MSFIEYFKIYSYYKHHYQIPKKNNKSLTMLYGDFY